MERYHHDEVVDETINTLIEKVETKEMHTAAMDRVMSNLDNSARPYYVKPEASSEDEADAKDPGKRDKKGKGRKGKGEKRPLTAREIAYKVIVFSLVGIILVSGYNLGKAAYNYLLARNEYKKISQIALVDTTKFTGEIDWDALHAVNDEVCAWIYLKDTIINYPIAHTDNNDYYLHRLINGTYNFAGTLFIDCDSDPNFSGFNTIVYGHHMKDGSMFKLLENYENDPTYHEKHKQFEIITEYEKYHLLVFASFVTDARSAVYDFKFADSAAKQAHIDMLRENSVFDASDVEVSAKDRIVTLSTCVYSDDIARYVVVGKLVPWTEEEKAEALKIQSILDGN